MAEPPTLLRAADIMARPFDFRHPLDENAEVRMFGLSRVTPLTRTAVTLSHVAPGRCAFPLHRHHVEEEWIYILSGCGALQRDDEETEIGPGDFAAFPAGGVAHKLTNTGTETLVYLMGGESGPHDIVDFPDQGVRLNRAGDRMDTAAADGFAPFDFMSRHRDG